MAEPQVRFAMAPVIALARSEAMKTAALATSWRVGSLPSTVPFSMYVRASAASSGHVSGIRKIVEELVERDARGEVIQERLDGDAGSRENWRAAN